jgi:hypothetical protein
MWSELLAGTDVGYGQWLSEPPLPGLLRAGRPVLLDATGEGAVTALARGWEDRVDLVAVSDGPAAMLVRPDGYVAWAADSAPCDGLRELTTWFGP